MTSTRATIRPLERSDLPAVVSLYEHVARSGSRQAPAGLERYFEETFFDHPWADPEIPSLVYVSDGHVRGFIGSSVRRLTFDGRAIRAGVAGQLVTDPSVRHHGAGMFLMRDYMAGPQELTLTDTASDAVRRIWERLGGDTSQLACVGWVKAFRPLRFASEYALQHGRHAAAWSSRALSVLVDPIARRALRESHVRPATTTRLEPLTAGGLADECRGLARAFAVVPAYDEEFAGWLLREVARVERNGELVARLVRGESGRVHGWYAYYRRPSAVGSVLQIAAADHDVGIVLDAMFDGATRAGLVGLHGRIEGHLRQPLADRGCVFHPSGYLALVHADDEALLRAIQSGRALLTRLEGEWWMGHHLVEATASERR